MDRYKKKNLKFMGKGPEVRAAEMNKERRSVRQQRFSLQRTMEDVDEQSQASKLPTLGISKIAVCSRLDMLKKWKEEKDLKRRLEMNSKKPVFKVGSARPQLDTIGLSRLQASRILPASKLAKISQDKISDSAKSDKSAHTIVEKKISDSAKSDKSAHTIVEKKIPTLGTKPTTHLPQRKPLINAPPSTNSSTTRPQPSQNLAKKLPAPSNFKPQSKIGVKDCKDLSAPSNFKPQSNNGAKSKDLSAPSNFKPQSNNGVKSKISNPAKPGKSAVRNVEKKIPTSGSKPTTLLPQRKPLFQNQPSKSKPFSSVQSKKAFGKAEEKPLSQDEEVQNQTDLAIDQSLFLQSCPLSAIEPKVPAKDKSFAPADFEFRPSKIRSSWLDDEGPFSILSRVKKEMKLRTSTPIKKEAMEQQELESSLDNGNSMNTGAGSSNAIKEYSTIPNSDTKYIESLIDSSSANLPELDNDKNAVVTSIDNSMKTGVSSSDAKKEYSTIPNSDTKCIDSLIDSSSAKLPQRDDDRKVALTSIDDNAEDSKFVTVVDPSEVENQGLEPDISSAFGDLVLSEKENRKPVFDANSPAKGKDIEPSSSDVDNQELETSPEKKGILCVAPEKNSIGWCDEDTGEEDRSVFYPSEPPAAAAAAPLKSRRLFSSSWKKMEKPSLALISESPENSKDVPRTPKSHRRKELRAEDFTPRRSSRLLGRKSELKEENIFDVKECYLDSPTVEAATRMSMSTTVNRGRVSLLYTPPRRRASNRISSLKGDLMTFSPTAEGD